MILPILALIFIFITYKLFVRGYLFKLIMVILFPVFGRAYLWANFVGTHATVMTIAGFTISWAMMIPMTIVILTLMTTGTEE